MTMLWKLLERLHEYDIFVNFDQETYDLLQPTFDLMEKVSETYDNVGTVIQAYFFKCEREYTEKYKDYRLAYCKRRL